MPAHLQVVGVLKAYSDYGSASLSPETVASRAKPEIQVLRVQYVKDELLLICAAGACIRLAKHDYLGMCKAERSLSVLSDLQHA